MFEYSYDDKLDALFVSFGKDYIPRMTVQYLHRLNTDVKAKVQDVRPSFVVFRSLCPGIFNLGGDLEFFYKKIADPLALQAYADLCVDVIMLLQSGLGVGAHTFAVVEGECLGGGLEGALACDQIISGTEAIYSFPEANFGMFPGMGGYQFVRNKVDEPTAFEMCSSGKVYKPVDMLAKGLVHRHTCDPMSLTADLLARWQHKDPGWKHLMQVRRMSNIVSRDVLNSVVEYWVQSVQELNKEQVNKLKTTIRAQNILDKRKVK